MDHIEMCGRFRYSPGTSRYLSACPDLDYFRLADNLGDIAWWPDCLRRGSDYARERAITRVMSSCCSLPLLGSGRQQVMTQQGRHKPRRNHTICWAYRNM